MAVTYLVAIDLNKNEIQNVALQNLASAPSSPATGQAYFDTVLGYARIWNGSAWQRIDGHWVDSVSGTAPIVSSGGATPAISITAASSGAAGSMSAADKSKLDAAASAATPSALVIRDSSGRAQVVDPSAAADIATKSYVDAVAQGLSVKGSVRAATITALPTNSRSGNILTASANGALAAIDGVTLVLGDRLLVKNEATGANNGIYTVTQVGTGSLPFILTRATDMDTSAEAAEGAFTFIEEGTTLAKTGWIQTTGSVTLNTTTLTFAQMSAASSYVAGNGLQLVGTTFSVVNADSTITVAAGGISVTSPKLKYTTNIGDGSTTAIVITHSLGTKDVIVQVYRNSSPWDTVICDVERTSTSTITLRFTTAPTTNQFSVVVLG